MTMYGVRVQDGQIVGTITNIDPERVRMQGVEWYGTREAFDARVVELSQPETDTRRDAIQEAIRDEPADSPVRLLGEALLGKTATEIEATRSK